MSFRKLVFFIYLCITLLYGATLALDFPAEGGESYSFNGTEINFKNRSTVVDVRNKSSLGYATVGGSSMVLRSDMSWTMTFLVCNHEMLHVKGATHEDMSLLQGQGFDVSKPCVSLMKAKLI